MRKLNVLCDMDGIVVGLCGHWLKLIERDHGIKADQSQIDHWKFEECEVLKSLPPNEIYRYMETVELWRDAPPLPGALEGLVRLKDAGHNVVIVTAPANATSVVEKWAWLKKHAPWIPKQNIITTDQKHLVRGDILIDDRADTLVKYASEWPDAGCLGIEYEYNKNAIPDTRDSSRIMLLPDYRNTAQAWRLIVEVINSAGNLLEKVEGTLTL